MDKANIKQTETRQHYRINDEIEFALYILPDLQQAQQGDPQVLEQALFPHGGAEHFKAMQAFDSIDYNARNLAVSINKKTLRSQNI